MARRAAATTKRTSAPRSRALGDGVSPRADAMGLCRRPFDLDLSDPDGHRDPDLQTFRADGKDRCRKLLDALLRPAWPTTAAFWSDVLIAQFGSLPAVLAAGASDRARIVGPAASKFLGEIQAGLLHCLRLPLAARPVVSTSKQLLDYLKADMANLITERFRVLFLTSQNELISDDLVWEGTVGEAPAYPREVVKRALEVGAAGIILVHNHPSGSHQPSQGDIEATRRVAIAASIMGICLHDHIIISRKGWASFRMMGHLDTSADLATD